MGIMIKKFKLDIIFEIVVIFILSVLLMRIIGKFGDNNFLFDDNRTQWLPIIDSSFNTVFKEGYLPFIDFYQMKGMNILDIGFYSLINPFMWLAYIIKSVFLDSQVWNTITVYIYMMFAFGNIIVFFIFKNFNLKKIYSIVLTFSYATCTCYMFLGYWYYVFNSYMILPLILLIMIKYYNKKQIYYMIGIALAMSIYMGNLQYTVYQYIAIGIIMLVLAKKNNKQYLKVLSCNVLVSIMLGWPQLILAFRASQNSDTFSSNINSDFFSDALNPIKFMIGGMLPIESLKNWIPSIENWVKKIPDVDFEYRGGIECYFIGGLLVCFFICVGIYIKKYINKETYLINNQDEEMKFLTDITLGLIVSAMFFILFMFGYKFIIAFIMSEIPIVKNFRFLNKIITIIPPLLIIPAAYIFKINIEKKFKSCIIAISFILAVIGIGNYSGIDESIVGSGKSIVNQKAMDYKSTSNRLSELQIDLKNYRIATFVEYRNYDANEFYDAAFEDMEKKIIRNTATPLGVFSIGGYNINYDKMTLKQSDTFLKDSSFSYLNGIRTGEFFQKIQEDDSLKENVYEQINNNALKYFLFKNDSKFFDIFINLINESSIFKVASVKPFLDDYNIIEIQNVSSLCSDENNKKILMDSSMGKLYVKLDNKEQKTLSLKFTFNDKYRAKFTANDGKYAKNLDINKTEDGYMEVLTDNLDDGKIEVYYYDIISNLAVIFSIMTTLLSLILLIYTWLQYEFI